MTDTNPMTKQIGKLLADDPICGGRVASGTIEAIAALVSCPSGDDVEREIDAILAKSDDEILGEELFIMLGKDGPTLTRDEMLKAMAYSFEQGKNHILLLNAAQEQAALAAMPATPKTDDWRCVNCKRVIAASAEPERCPDCHCSEFAHIWKPPATNLSEELAEVRAERDALLQRSIDAVNVAHYWCRQAEEARADLSDLQRRLERYEEAFETVKERCFSAAGDANWDHDILSIVVPVLETERGLGNGRTIP